MKTREEEPHAELLLYSLQLNSRDYNSMIQGTKNLYMSQDMNLMDTKSSIAFASHILFLTEHHPARGTLFSISCLVVGGGGMTAPLDPFRSRRWRICAAGSSID